MQLPLRPSRAILHALLAVLLSGWSLTASPVSASDLFLSPSLVPYAQYIPILLNPGATYVYQSSLFGGNSLKSVQVLPLLRPNPAAPAEGEYTSAQLAAIDFANSSTYFDRTAGVDYFADLVPTNAAVSFNSDGSYFIRLTDSTDASIFSYVQVGDSWIPDGAAPVGPNGPERRIDTPKADVNIVSKTESTPEKQKAVDDAAAALAADGQTVVRADTVDEAVKGIKDASDAAGRKVTVNLVGHGAPGRVKIGGDRIGDGFTISVADFQAKIDPYVSFIRIVACEAAQGDAGSKMLLDLAKSIGSAAGYTVPVTVTGGHFDLDAKAKLSLTEIPEPATFWLLAGGLLLIRLRRR
jgi:hypothetical protein